MHERIEIIDKTLRCFEKARKNEGNWSSRILRNWFQILLSIRVILWKACLICMVMKSSPRLFRIGNAICNDIFLFPRQQFRRQHNSKWNLMAMMHASISILGERHWAFYYYACCYLVPWTPNHVHRKTRHRQMVVEISKINKWM